MEYGDNIKFQKKSQESVCFYQEEEITFKNKEAGITLSGTLTIPRGFPSFPSVIFIAGSGPNDRNASKEGHQTFSILADYLSRNGIGTLRFDKRGCGTSSGNFEMATSLDFLSDAMAAVEYMKSREDVNERKIGVLGHSEGGMIASMIAQNVSDLAFIVMMVSPAVNGVEILLDQCSRIARALGESENVICEGSKHLSRVCDIIQKEKGTQKVKQEINALHKEFVAQFSRESIFSDATLEVVKRNTSKRIYQVCSILSQGQMKIEHIAIPEGNIVEIVA